MAIKLDNRLSFALESDNKDDLKHFRNQFIIPRHNDKDAIYFVGNSLGLQPKRTAEYVQEVLQRWGQYGVEGFFMGSEPWLHYHDHLVGSLAKIVGARPGEVVVMNQLTVNLHLMLVSFYQPSGKRNKILCEAKAFPSDQYMLETHIRHRGINPDEIIIEVKPGEKEHTIREKDLLKTSERYSDEIELVLWGGEND